MRTDVLSRHHAELDRRIASLLVEADGGDARALGREWSRFAGELLRHFSLEERVLFPRLEREQPDEVVTLLREHAELKSDLVALGVRADLHFLRADAVRAFVAALRTHAEREDALLYRWAAERVDADTWERISDVLFDGARTVGDALSSLGAGTL
jgi:hemerythrin-like domain-containing protein